jgi:hypothetical protein
MTTPKRAPNQDIKKENASKPADPKRRHERAVGDELLKALDIKAAFKRLGDDRGEPGVFPISQYTGVSQYQCRGTRGVALLNFSRRQAPEVTW